MNIITRITTIILSTLLLATPFAFAQGDIPNCGTVLFQESFNDGNVASRGWYDTSGVSISTSEHAPGSNSSFECSFAPGANSCSGGHPGRRKFPDAETLYLSFYIKFSNNWVGSGRSYHPHMFHFISNLDSDYVGPANAHLVTYAEVVQKNAFMALQDSRNVDTNCILLNNDSFVGCNGDFNSYVFSENRSSQACNGLVGELDQRDCYNAGSYWYSHRSWLSDGEAFTDEAGPRNKNNWHHVEAYYEMNSIVNGVGVPNGKIRWVQDGETLISSDQILYRTGQYPNLAFDQFMMPPYIGDGSPVAQQFWVDEMVIATAKPGCGDTTAPAAPTNLRTN